jgi:integrase
VLGVLAGQDAVDVPGVVVAGPVGGRGGVPRIRLHDGRHTVNSLLAAAGGPDHIRAAWCGHTVAVNVATYTHARPEDLGRAAEALGKIHNLA